MDEQKSVVCVSHNMALTMICGKICNAVTWTSSAQVCYVCGAAPTQVNRIDEIVKKDVEVSTYSFGLSTVDLWIGFFEYMLHMS